MSLRVCSDLTAADWIVNSDLGWQRLVTSGPGGFAAHARVRFIPDPTHADQLEIDAEPGRSQDGTGQWEVMLQLLATETAHPDDCYFALWEGWGFPQSARRWPTFVVSDADGRPMRTYHLFHGSLLDAGTSMTRTPAPIWDPPEFSRGGPPAYVWPTDHAWCITADVDPHWAMVGAGSRAVARLIADPRLDAVAADPSAVQPTYR